MRNFIIKTAFQLTLLISVHVAAQNGQVISKATENTQAIAITGGIYQIKQNEHGEAVLIKDEHATMDKTNEAAMDETGQGKIQIPRQKPIQQSCHDAGGQYILSTERQGPVNITPVQFEHPEWVSAGATYGVTSKQIIKTYDSKAIAIVNSGEASSEAFPPFKGKEFTVNPYVSGTLKTQRGAKVLIVAKHAAISQEHRMEIDEISGKAPTYQTPKLSWLSGGCLKIEFDPNALHE